MSENNDDNRASFRKVEFDIEMLRALAKEKGRDKQIDRILEVLGVKDVEDALVSNQILTYI